MVKKKKKKKAKKKTKLSVRDYKKLERALENYETETTSNNNAGYAIGALIFVVLLVMKIIHRTS